MTAAIERQGLFVRRMPDPDALSPRISSSCTSATDFETGAWPRPGAAVIRDGLSLSGVDSIRERRSAYTPFKADVEYAHAKGIEIGGYTLMCASRDIGPENNCVDPATGKPGSKFGQSACLASEWSDVYFRRVLNFIDATGMDMIETDGPYHGDVCAATTHKHHGGLADSQFRQWQRCSNFYAQCLQRGMYINTRTATTNGAQSPHGSPRDQLSCPAGGRFSWPAKTSLMEPGSPPTLG